MNPRELKYHLWVMTYTGIYVFGVAMMWIQLLPMAGPENFILMALIEISAITLGLVVTVVVHKVAGRLIRRNLTFQIVFLMLTVYGIPLGIWGIRLRRALGIQVDEVPA